MINITWAMLAVAVYALTFVALMVIWRFSCWAKQEYHRWLYRRVCRQHHKHREFHRLINDLLRKQYEARNNPDESPEA